MIEILAPAGDYDTLKAAVCAGADAVYAGGERFGARAYAKNFSREELLLAIDYVHLHGRKLYLTVNTLVKEREFAELYEYLLPFYRQGLDAVIVQDLGVMDYVMRQFPGLPIHASTQMTITNVIAAKYLESLGVSRIVPARELALAEIQEISGGTGLEVECFVHGALCYCYSGQCLLSSMIGGRSGNRGQCAQPCRLSYAVEHQKAKDILSLKDLCTIQFLPDLIESGIHSFKIEGRMKQPEYVAAVVGMYRKYTELYFGAGREGFRVSEEDVRKLERVYQRRGYCGGYYYEHNGPGMLSLERPKQELHDSERPEMKIQEKINGKFMLSSGNHVTLYLQYQETRVEVTGPVAEEATKQPLTKERIEKQLQKTGNTPFVFENLEIHIQGNVFIPIQAVNELRRRGLEMLEERILQSFRRESPGKLSESEVNRPEDVSQDFQAEGMSRGLQAEGMSQTFQTEPMRITVSVETMEQLEAAASYPGTARIYVEDSLWGCRESRERLEQILPELKDAGREVYFAMARIFRREAGEFYNRHFDELAGNFDGVLVRNLESFLYVRERNAALPVVTDSSIYLWNRRAKSFWKKFPLRSMTAPVELNKWELGELGVRDMELIVYGHLPVMISAGCVRKNLGKCERKPGFLSMADRQHKKNIVKNECLYCYNVIYNSAPLVLADQYQELRKLGCKTVRLQFSIENKEKVGEILNLFLSAYTREKECPAPKGTFTRGHFKRGVK